MQDTNLTAELLKLETSHLQSDIRADRTKLESLLHDSFIEIGASGRTYTRDDILNTLPNEPHSHRTLIEFQARSLSTNLALTTYLTTQTTPATQQTVQARRSSIWDRSNGHWQLVFHQGTPI